MVSPLLAKAAPTGREIVNVTPERAGWSHIGFRALRLGVGDMESVQTDSRELCIVVLTGTVDVTVDGQTYAGLGTRQSVFEEVSPAAVYVPAGKAVTIAVASSCTQGAEVALCSAPGGADNAQRQVRVLDSAAMRRSVRGQGSNTRYVCDILPDSEPAHSLLVVEVRTPSGHSSSYPPHKHDTDDLPHQSFLEETYYHQVNPPQGFVFQRVYTDDRSIDEAMAVEHGDLVVVSKGYHPVSVPYGYESYYLNVMAGPKRVWQFHNDPQHSWLLDL